MTFTRLKCTPPKLSLHLDDLGRKILFHFEFGLLSSVFSIGSPQVAFFFKNIFYVLDAYGASIYILHHLEKGDKQYETNFWEGETFSCSHNTRTF